MSSSDFVMYETRSSDDSNSVASSEDFEVLSHASFQRDEPTLDISSLSPNNSALISIHPPQGPNSSIKHVPCDIVLVIDVSGSMSWAASLPEASGEDTAQKESSGLSVLDLTKHAARTILETLDEGDRLGLVSFSTEARVEQPLTAMTAEAKVNAIRCVENLRDESSTNLWAGIRAGLKLFEDASFNGNVQGLFVLTDGMPNHMCPQQGYAVKLKPILERMASKRPCVPTIHTFGFGYGILSKLLQAIAEVGNGNYAFIPDAGMIGTVFVHAVANLYSTYATAAELELTASDYDVALGCEMGLPTTSLQQNTIVVKLGNIQFGQSRDTIITHHKINRPTDITAKVTYKLPNGSTKVFSSVAHLHTAPKVSASAAEYHLRRAQLCNFLTCLCPAQDKSSGNPHMSLPFDVLRKLNLLAKSVKSSLDAHSNDHNIASLLNDLVGEGGHGLEEGHEDNSTGQVLLALTSTAKKPYYTRWGAHYLPSLLHAHRRQTCNSFKDSGPLRYGSDSPLFRRCRDELDAAFDDLPAPRPSIPVYTTTDATGRKTTHRTVPVSMSRYNRYDNGCYLGSCVVTLATADGNGTTTTTTAVRREIAVRELATGAKIWNPITQQARRVVAVLETKTRSGSRQMVYHVKTSSDEQSGLWVTGYHPIFYRGQWTFPRDIADKARLLSPDEPVYTVILEPSSSTSPDSADSHAVEISGIACVTLGHGVTLLRNQNQNAHTTRESADNIRPHPFFGDYNAILRSLSGLKVNEQGHHVSAGVARDPDTGLANAFMPVVDFSGLSETMMVEDYDEKHYMEDLINYSEEAEGMEEERDGRVEIAAAM